MICYKNGNLLDDDSEALVNTVNTVGVMGKGIALMFREKFPENTRAYTKACREGRVQVGSVFPVHLNCGLWGPHWVVNFPTKKHWRNPSEVEWIDQGLRSLRLFIEQNGVRSIAIPALGAGNGRLPWGKVKELIERHLSGMSDVVISVYEPTNVYQNTPQTDRGVILTPARAALLSAIARYATFETEYSLLEIQKIAWFLDRTAKITCAPNLDYRFEAGRYGPYSHNVIKVIEHLDGTWLKSPKRISDMRSMETVWIVPEKVQEIQTYLQEKAKLYLGAVTSLDSIIRGFAHPLGMELLSTVDWLLIRGEAAPTVDSIRKALGNWPAGVRWADRKNRLFSNSAIESALSRLTSVSSIELYPDGFRG